MRNFFLALLAAAGASVLAPQQASAQYYYVPFLGAGQNPGGLNTDDEYPVGGGLAADWVTIVTGSAGTATAPVWSPVQALPWAFQFNGQPVTDFMVSTSGVLTFTTSATAVPGGNNVALPAASIPDNSICVWGIQAGANDFIVTKEFGAAPNRQLWVQFNSCTHVGSANSYVYWSIVLEEGTNNIYMVDQRTSVGTTLTVGVQVNGTTAVQVSDSPLVDSPDQGDPTPGDNSYYAFYPGVQPSYDLAMRTLELPRYAGIGTVPLYGDLLNLGASTITSYDLNYSINGGTPVTQPVSGVNIAPLAVDPYGTLGAAMWQPTTSGNYTVRVWASNLNGNPDQVPGNDTIMKVVTVVDSTVTRKVVEESFTSSTCPPCRQGNINVRAVNQANPGKYVRVAYQQNFPAPGNDPYYTAESGARFQFYNGSYIPYMILDGGWGDNSQSLTSTILNQFQAVPGVMKIDAEYTITGRTVSATARIRPYVSFPANQLVAHMIITERTTVNNARTNGETEFHDVMKKMMPNANGNLLGALSSGQTQTLTQSYTFPATNNVESFDSLQVVIFVQDQFTKEVFNGATGMRMLPTGLGADASVGTFALVPNPAVGGNASLNLSLVNAQSVTVDVLDALGRVVLSRPTEALTAGAHVLPLNLTAAPHGLYVVRVKTGATTLTQRLVVE